MKAKKSRKAELETKKRLFFKIGLLLALSVVYMAFQIKTYETSSLMDFYKNTAKIDGDFFELTVIKPELPPPPPPKMDFIDFSLVDDDEIDSNLEPVDYGADGNTINEPLPEPFASAPEENLDDDIPWRIVEKEPAYPGGESARLKFLRENIKYPRIAVEAGIQGPVYVGFVVEKDGSISDVKLLRGIGGGCDEEALRVTAMMPKWEPGLQRNIPVRVQYQMEIRFTLK